MPTLMPLTPRSARYFAPSAVATLPAIISKSPNRARNASMAFAITTEWPCAMSMTSTSTPARMSSAARSRKSPFAPIAAPTRSRPCASRVASGSRFCLTMSLAVMRPVSTPSLSTSGSFLIFRSIISCCASSSEMSPSCVTRRSSGVIRERDLLPPIRQIARRASSAALSACAIRPRPPACRRRISPSSGSRPPGSRLAQSCRDRGSRRAACA